MTIFKRLALAALCLVSTAASVSAVQTNVYFVDDTANPWPNVNIYTWFDGVTNFGNWPGEPMTKTSIGGRDVWTITIDITDSNNAGLIFNDGTGGNITPDNQTANLVPYASYLYMRSNPTAPTPFDPANPVFPSTGGDGDGGDTGAVTTGTLPVLYINVYDENGDYDNEVISKDLDHKNYFSGEYWLDVNGCQWMIDEGAASVGSEESPLPLQIKARGNYTRTAFSKKPFKLKLDKKQNLLGLTPDKSKHYAILAHADDWRGFLRNFVGFDLGRRIGLPWTPKQQPVEVIINGDYRGLYFLTESIRIDDGRVEIEELEDNETERTLISGGYLVELDNYEEENQIQMVEKGCVDVALRDMLRITYDTPEEYSDIQRRFVSDQFTAMNDGVGVANTSDDIWRYLDLDDAARYYVVEEIISHVEAYHGSTYLFRDRGEGQKWHFSPLWDCGNAFNGPTNGYIYDNAPYGMTWIASLRANDKFNDKVKETWKWFMTNCYDGLMDDIDTYVNHISVAAVADYNRWKDVALPSGEAVQAVSNNSDMQSCRRGVVDHLNAKIDWLKGQFGDYTVGGPYAEPARDQSEAAPLPAYAKEPDESSLVTVRFVDEHPNPWAQPHAYVYGKNEASGIGNYEVLGGWPGTAMLPETPMARSSQAWTLTIKPEYKLDDNARIIFNEGKIGGEETTNFSLVHGATYNRQGITSLIEAVVGDDSDATVRYFNLQGIEVDAPVSGGVYIRQQGSDVTKVVL